MIKTVGRTRSAAPPSVLHLRDPARRDGQPTGISIFNKRVGAGTVAAVARRSRARGCRCSGRSGARSSLSIRRPKRGWLPAASGSRRSSRSPPRSPRAARRRRSSTARAAPRSSIASICSRPRRHGRARTEDGSRGVHGRITVRSSRALEHRPLGNPVKLYVCGPTPMMRACRAARRHARPRLRRLARAGDGLRPRRLLQLRGPRTDPDGGTPHHTRTCIDGPVFDAQRVVWERVAGTEHGSVCLDRIADARQPAHRRERLLRLRRRVRRRRRSRRRSAASRSKDCSSPSAKGTRRRASSRPRRAC